MCPKFGTATGKCQTATVCVYNVPECVWTSHEIGAVARSCDANITSISEVIYLDSAQKMVLR